MCNYSEWSYVIIVNKYSFSFITERKCDPSVEMA